MRVWKIMPFVLWPIVSLSATQSFSLEEVTHRAINENIAQRTVINFSLNEYVKSNLDLKDGVYTPLNGTGDENVVENRQVFQWLGYGGMQEDRPGSWSDYISGRPTRSVNHFSQSLKAMD